MRYDVYTHSKAHTHRSYKWHKIILHYIPVVVCSNNWKVSFIAFLHTPLWICHENFKPWVLLHYYIFRCCTFSTLLFSYIHRSHIHYRAHIWFLHGLEYDSCTVQECRLHSLYLPQSDIIQYWLLVQHITDEEWSDTAQVDSLTSVHHTQFFTKQNWWYTVCCSSKHAHITEPELHSFIYIMDWSSCRLTLKRH